MSGLLAGIAGIAFATIMGSAAAGVFWGAILGAIILFGVLAIYGTLFPNEKKEKQSRPK